MLLSVAGIRAELVKEMGEIDFQPNDVQTIDFWSNDAEFILSLITKEWPVVES